MYAYSELYVSDAARSLGEYFDYMICDLHYDTDEAFAMFANSIFGKCFGEGNPKYVSGMTGIELAQDIIHEAAGVWEEKEATQPYEKSREYWAGWALAQYQWYREVTFKELVERGLKASQIVGMYILHEADIEKFYYEVDRTILRKLQ